jgi:predicted GNAT superfamily acetyltransferase
MLTGQWCTLGKSALINIQPLTDLDHLDEAVALQRTIWGYTDLDVESRAMLVIASRFAGQFLGAFNEGRLIGIALAFFTAPNSELRLHSHRVGVLEEFQNQGIGRMLKLAQREDALCRGIKVIQWTFDPLQRRNAYFNIEKLGGIARRYIPNLYGITSSPLHGGLPTDRLLIEWELESPRVLQILSGKKPAPSAEAIRISVPDFTQRKDPELQLELRNQLVENLSSGYAVTGFEKSLDRAFYLLEKS